MSRPPPDPSLVWLWVDFQACGFSGQPDDDCYYVFDALAKLPPTEGLVVFAYNDDGNGELLGKEVRLEKYANFHGPGFGWRLRPLSDDYFFGKYADLEMAIRLTMDEAVVLQNFLTRVTTSLELAFADRPETQALRNLHQVLSRILPEALTSGDRHELLQSARDRLRDSNNEARQRRS